MTTGEVPAEADRTPARPMLRPTVATGSSTALLFVGAVVMALLLGVVIGRLSVPRDDRSVGIAVLEREIVPRSVDADSLWTGGTSSVPAIGEHLSALRRDESTDGVLDHATAWQDAYVAILQRMVGVDVPAPARPVQRQFVLGVTLSKDALELLVEAARTDDPALRRELSGEALRLRTRSEQVTQTARASLVDLQGGGSGVSVPGDLPSFADLR